MPTLPGVRGNSEDQHRQDPEIQAARNGEGDLAAGTLFIELPSQRPQPSRKRLTKEPNLLLAALRLAIERCPPLHECSVAVNDGHESQGCPVILHRYRPCVGKFVGLRPLDVGHRKPFWRILLPWYRTLRTAPTASPGLPASISLSPAPSTQTG